MIGPNSRWGSSFLGSASTLVCFNIKLTLLHDSVVLLLLGSSLESLPGKLTSEEVLIVSLDPHRKRLAYHKDVTKRLEIISSRLFNTQMSIDRSVPSSTSQVLVLPVGDMQMSLGVSVLLGETEINDIDLIASFPNAHEEIVGLDISVDKVSRVNVFDSRDELVGEEKDSLEGEFSVTEVE
jgi:hypothetical protein